MVLTGKGCAHLSNPPIKRKLSVLLVAALVLFLSLTCLGQAYFGTVSGELTDATSAVVTGAKVILTDQEKGFNFQTTSDSSGRYLFRSIPPGVYVVTVEAAGFAKTESARFKVDVNENATANVTLRVAVASQSVQVESAAQAIQTEDAETGQVVNRRFINDLPLIDRNIESLTALAPGVTEMDDQCPEPCLGTNFVSNGSRGATADILLDGASVTNSEPNGGITSVTYLPSPEAVEEVLRRPPHGGRVQIGPHGGVEVVTAHVEHGHHRVLGLAGKLGGDAEIAHGERRLAVGLPPPGQAIHPEGVEPRGLEGEDDPAGRRTGDDVDRCGVAVTVFRGPEAAQLARRRGVREHGELLQIGVAAWMVGHGDHDVVSSGAGDDGRVVKPVLPPAGFTQQLQIAARQPFDELVREVRDVW